MGSDVLLYGLALVAGVAIAWKESTYPSNLKTVLRKAGLRWAAAGLIAGLLLTSGNGWPLFAAAGYLARLFYFDAQLRHETALRAIEQGDFGTGGTAGIAPPPAASAALHGTRATPEN